MHTARARFDAALETATKADLAKKETAVRALARPLDVMTFAQNGLITSMRAWWSADTIFSAG